MLFTPWLSSVKSCIRRSRSIQRRTVARRDQKSRLPLSSELLEARTLLTGPAFVSVSPNVGEFLQDGDVRNQAPQELLFQFSPGQTINNSTVGAIQLVAAGHDSSFRPASTVTDFGTGGQVTVRLGTQRLGAAEDGTQLTISSMDNAGNGPIVTAGTGTIDLTLDSSTLSPTTVQDLLDLVANDPAVAAILSIEVIDGDPATDISAAPGGTLTLSGAGAADAVTDLGTDSDLRVRAVANSAGVDGNRISLQINRLDLSGTDPAPQVNVVGNRIEVVLNDNAAAPTRAQDLVDALAADADALALVTVTVDAGDAATDISGIQDGSLIALSGADRALTAGYLNVGDSANEVIYRFSESLPDDDYRIQIIGTGANPLTNAGGEAFEEGADHFQTLSLDLGAQVKAVVPQPVLRKQKITINDQTLLSDGDTFTIDPGTLPDSFAQTSSDFGTAAAATVTLTALDAGTAGNGIELLVSRSDFGGAGDPTVTVTGRTISVTLNSNTGNESTSQDLVDAINGSDEAAALVAADHAGASTDITTLLTTPVTLTLGGAVDLYVFEINDLSVDAPGTVRSGNIAVDIDLASMATGPEDVAGAIAAAINGASLSVPDVTAADDGVDTVTVLGGAFDVRVTAVTQDSDAVTQRAGGIVQRRNLVNVWLTDDEIDEALATDPDFYRLFDTNETQSDDDDFVLLPQTVHYSPVDNTVVLDFGSDLPDATYRLETGTSPESDATLDEATQVGRIFNGSPFSETAVIGNDAGAEDVDLFQVELLMGHSLIVTSQPDANLDSFLRLFDVNGNEITAVVTAMDQGTGMVDMLTWTTTASDTYYIGVSSEGNETYMTDGTGAAGGSSTGSFQLMISTDAVVSADDDNSSFGTATPIGELGAATTRFSSSITGQNVPLPPPAGGPDEPGHREIPAESHGVGPGTARALPGGLGVQSYSFPTTYGVNAQGDTLFNQITEDQKTRAREIFEIYGDLYGFEVREVTTGGIRIVTGDPRAVSPTVPPGAVGGIAGGGLVVMNSFVGNGFDAIESQYGNSWMGIALHEIGHAIGLLHSYDVPSEQGNGTLGEDQYPGYNDIVHGERLSPNDGTDIDMYQFNVDQSGTFKAEIIAERLGTTSLLNSVLRLYQEDPDTGERTLIAQNDDYFSNDAYIELDLLPTNEDGTPYNYFVGVSSTGNTDYDPTVSDTGFGGTSEGVYDLKLTFDAAPNSSLEDANGNAFDGDNDGKAGGTHSFFFKSANTLFVDKSVITNLTGSLNSAVTSVPVTDVSVFTEAAPFNIIIDSEEMMVTNIDAATNTLTVVRAQNATTAVSHAVGKPVRPATADGSMANPFGLIGSAVSASSAGDIIRVVGNGGADNDILTADDARPYLLGLNSSFVALEDGSKLEVPQAVTLQIDSGAVVKSQSANIDAGTSAVGIDRSEGAIQVLGTPGNEVRLTSYANDLIGGDSNGAGAPAMAGDWGGLVFRNDSDFLDMGAGADDPGIFLNYVNFADISFGGGKVSVDSVESVFTPIHIETTRPTITNNVIRDSSDAAMSANPDAFDDSRGRIGPDIYGNTLRDNSINGIFVRIETAFGAPIDRLSRTARFDDTDITHVITENLEIVGNPGGPLDTTARLSGRLAIDPGVVVKLGNSRIELLRGNSHLIAEGTPNNPVIITSTQDDRFGSGGTFDTTNNGTSQSAAAGDWGGLVFNATTRGSIDQALIAFGGGQTPIEGSFDNFNTIEIQDRADVRIANSTFQNNAAGGGGNRNGRGSTSQATIFVRQSQPIIVNNVFENNLGSVVHINSGALIHNFQRDTGRSTGELGDFSQFADNHGPLIRLNRMAGNGTNGMTVRGETLATETVWDDTDIVHVLTSEITVNQHHTYSGIRLQSNPGESLVVKLSGGSAGFTADGIQLDIDDRIGGTVQIIGRPGFPVVLTSIHDDSVGAGLDPDGFPLTDTNNNGTATSPSPGNWRSLLFLEDSNDRNVRVFLEAEDANNGGIESNDNQGNAQFLGELAPQHVTGPTPADLNAIDTVVRLDGDDNRPLGFEIHGFVSADDSGDVDVYSFKATAGSEIWIDLDRTRGAALDPVIELVQADGTVLASARYDHTMGEQVLTENFGATGDADVLEKFAFNGGDFYTFNPYDTGFRAILPGTAGAVGTYFVRVRSNQATAGEIADTNQLKEGLTSGEYQLQIRLRQVDEKPGSTVQFADIRYATTGIDIQGLPAHSPLLSESIETTQANGPNQTHQPLGNLLESDKNTLNAGGTLNSASDIDFFQFNSDYAQTILGPSIQSIGGVNDGGKTWTAVFDLDYADGLTRADTTLTVYDANGVPILIGRESNIEDDQPATGNANDLDDLSRGTVGKLDPFIGPVQLNTGTPGQTTNYSYSVSSNAFLNNQLDQFYVAGATNQLTRLEPVNSVDRIIEDHIGTQGYDSNGAQRDPLHANGLFDIGDEQSLSTHVRDFDLADVPLYISTGDTLQVYNPLFGEQIREVDNDFAGNNNFVGDIVMRSDGTLYAYEALGNVNDSVGRLAIVDPGTGALTNVGNDNIIGETGLALGASANNDMDDLTTSDAVSAVTFRRNGPGSGAGYWEGYYAVVENEGAPDLGGPNPANDGLRNSKLYRFNADTGAVENSANDTGFVNIQYSGTTYATTTLFTNDGTNTGTIQIQANAPGTAGNGITVNLTRVTNIAGARVTSVGGRTINVQVDDGGNAQQIVEAINNDDDASRLVQASRLSNNNIVASTSAGEFFGGVTTGGVTGVNDVVLGNVTGLAFDLFSGGQLHGITNRGELLEINRTSGAATLVYDFTEDPLNFGVSDVDFRGLALAPQNLHGGLFSTGTFSNTLFTINATGELVAFRIGGAAGIERVLAFGDDSEVQQLDVAGTPTGGTFTLTFISDAYGPLTTTDLDFDATAAEIQMALESLVPIDRLGATATSGSVIQPGDVVVTGTTADAGDIQIAFQGFYLDKGVEDLQVDNGALVGGPLSVSNAVPDSFATATTDYGTAGAVTLDYTAVAMGAPGAGITIDVISDDLGPTGMPMINVGAQTITVTLNNNPGNESTYQDLEDTINGSVPALALITPNLTGNGALTIPATTTKATASSNYGTFGAFGVTVDYTAVAAGVAGDDIDIVVQTADLGMGGAPTVSVNGAMDQITVTLNNLAGSESTAQDLKDAIDMHGTASGLVTVALTGNANADLGGTLAGITTVTTGGNFVLPVGSSVTAGNFNPTIGGDGIRETWLIDTGQAGATGLAFSPLDFNLWHPTETRGGDAGHGVNPSYDLTRGGADGEVSFYFGLEQFVTGNTPYLNFEAGNTQLGVLDNEYQRDLTLRDDIGDNYNLAGGALGSLLTDPFDLISDTGTETNRDRPTLYFTYFLDDEGTTSGQDGTDEPDGEFTDSARAFISNDGGRTWSLLATNNSPRGDDSELPHYASHTRLANNSDPRQEVQELFDDTGTWRQARIDLSDYVGQTGLRLRFDFSTAGTIVDAGLTTNDSDLATPVDGYGSLSGGDAGYTRSQNNNNEGFYIDDIIIGWSERGEMITAAQSDEDHFQVPQPPEALMLPEELLAGAYQVEIRRGFEYAGTASPTDPEIIVNSTFDTNARFIPGSTLGLPDLSDDFELNDADETTNDFNPAIGWIPNSGISNAAWSVDGTVSTVSSTLASGITSVATTIPVVDGTVFPQTGSFEIQIGTEFITIGSVAGNTLNVTQRGFGGSTAVAHTMSDTVAMYSAAVSGQIDDNEQSVMQFTQTTTGITFDYRVDADEGDTFQVFVDDIGGLAGPAFFSGDTGGAWQTATISVSPGVHTFFFVYLKDGLDSGGNPLEKLNSDEQVLIDNLVVSGIGATFIRGDRNVERQQGHFQVEGNIIRDVSSVGISVAPGARDAGTGFATPSSPINFATMNTQRLAPSVSIVNNVVAGFGNAGVRFRGDANSGGTATNPASAVPYGKLINNTIYGGQSRSGTGIQVQTNASPTLLNNIVVNTVTGISVDGSSSSTVVGRTYFQNNATNGTTGQNPVIDGIGNPLFVDPSVGNFYLADGSEAIDRSLASLPDRAAFVSFKNDLLLPNSDAFSPDEDLFGQKRVDDHTQLPSGLGGEVFNDLGAIERADFIGGVASLIVPEDNGDEDLDPLATVVHIDQPDFFNQFIVQLTDAGIGIDDATVALDGSQFVLTRTLRTGTQTLVGTYSGDPNPPANPDYVFAYNANTNEAILTSVTLYDQDARYELTVDNSAGTGIKDAAGNALVQNQSDGTVRFDILVTNGPNDPPVNTVPGTQTVDENTVDVATSVTFSSGNGNAISVDDPDAFINTNELQVTLSVTSDGGGAQGTFTLPAGFSSLVTLNSGTGTDDASVSFTGDIDDLNTVLDGLVFTPRLNFNGTATVTVFTDDLGNFSADQPLLPMTDSDNINIVVTPVNSAPVATSPVGVNVNEDTDFDFTNTITVSDAVDGDLGDMLVTISVDQGTLSLSGVAGLAFQNMETGSDEASMSFTGTVTDINAALNGLLYHPYGAGSSPNGANQHFNGTATLTLTIDDQGNTGDEVPPVPLSDTSTTTITVDPINDPPVISVDGTEFTTNLGAPADFTSLERTPFVFDAAGSSLITIEDVDTAEDTGMDSGKVEVVLTATDGTLTLGDNMAATITAGAEGTTTITLFDLVANINTVLDGLTYTPDMTFVSAVAGRFGTVKIDVDDNGRSGTVVAGTTDSETIELDVLEVNDAPVITFANVTQAESVNEDNTLTLSSGGTNNFTVSDSPLDPMPGGGDLFQVMLTVSQGTLSLNGTAGLDFMFAADGDGSPAGDGSSDATMTFRGNLTDVNAALDGLVYTPGLHYRGADTLMISVNDLGHFGAGGSRSTSDMIAIAVDAVNDDPEINAPMLVQAVEDTDLTFSVSGGNGISVTDIEDDPTGTGTGLYQLTLDLPDMDGTLSLSTTSGLNFSFSDGNGTGTGDGTDDITMTFRGTQADINAALNGLVYTPPAGVDGENRTLDIELNDLGNLGLVGPDDGIVNHTLTIQIDGDNDAPVNVVPGAQTIEEDTDLVFSATAMTPNAIQISDIDAGGGTLQVTLTATNGVLTLGDESLVDFAFTPDGEGSPQGDGIADSSMTFRGTLGNINAALEGLVFRGLQDFAGPAQIEIEANDLGNTGVAPNNLPLSDLDTVAITVTPVNDAPMVTAQGPLTVAEDMDVTISAANANQVAVSDIDLGSGKLLVTLTVDHGTLRLFRTTGLVFSDGDGIDDQTMTFSGGQTAVNLALDGMIYTPDPGYVGMDMLTVELDDQGSTGDGGPMTASQDIPITISPENDAPVLSVPGTQSTNEDVSLTFAAVNGNAISAADIDVNETMGGKVEVTLGVGNGTLTLSTTSGLSGDTDGSDGALQFQGTLNAVNVALSGLRYTPTSDFSGTDTLDVEVSDLGNTGNGGILTDDGSVTINVSSVNDAPVNSLQSTVATVSEDPLSPLEFTTGNSNLISVSDADVQVSEDVQVTLSVNNGTLTLNGTSGLSFSFSDANGTGSGTGTGDASMTFRGTLADINAALDGLDYQPNANFSGSDTLTVTSNDLGQNGSGGAKTDTDTLAITVTGQNDAPVADDDSFTVLVGSFVNGNVLANDSDVDGPSLAVVDPLVTDVMHGTLNIDFVTGQFTYTPDSMTDETSDSFQYTITDGLLAGNTATVTIGINAAPTISGATFSIAENSGSGVAVGTVSVSDPNMDDVSLSIIAGNTASAFAIDNDGNITVNNPAALDFESTPNFTLTVRATDDAPVPGSRDATVTVNLTDAAEAVTIGSADFATASGQVTVRRDGTKVRFVDTGSGLDIAGAPVHEFANVTSLTFVGQDDASDTLTVDFATGNPLPAGGLSYEGGSGAGSDTLVLEDGGAVTFTNVTHTFTSSSSGSVDIDGQTIAYTGLEPIEDNLDADARVFNFGSAVDDVTISDASAGDGLSTISSTASSETVTFDTSGSTVTVNLGGGSDSLQATGIDSTFGGRVIVNAGDGADTVNLSALTVDATINGNNGDDTITGGSGNDQLVGNSGNDVVQGGAGDDNVIGGAGRDTVSGGAGNNMVDGNGTSFDVLVEDVAGNVVLTNGALTWDTGSNTLNRIEGIVIVGSSGSDSLDASAFSLFGVRMEGGDGNDTIRGTSLNDVIFADGGNDLVTAGSGNDIVFGGAGDDLLIGNAGRDQVNGDDGNDRVLGGAGVDTLSGGLGNDDIDGQGATGDVLRITASGSNVTVSTSDIVHGAETDLHNRVERIEVTLDDSDNEFDGGAYTGRLFVYAMGGNDTILGGLGADVVFAGEGNDIVDGRAGNDIVYGGAGTDALRGGTGIDRLIGHADDDTILGSEGNDFVFGGAGRDLILGEGGDDLVKGQGGRDNLAGGGNGTTASAGDVIVAGTGDTIDDAFSFDFDALLI